MSWHGGASNEYPQHMLWWRNKTTVYNLDTDLIAPVSGGIYIIFFLFLHKNIYCGFSLEAPHWGTSNEYPQYICFLCRMKKNRITFWLKKSLLPGTMWVLIWNFDIAKIIWLKGKNCKSWLKCFSSGSAQFVWKLLISLCISYAEIIGCWLFFVVFFFNHLTAAKQKVTLI